MLWWVKPQPLMNKNQLGSLHKIFWTLSYMMGLPAPIQTQYQQIALTEEVNEVITSRILGLHHPDLLLFLHYFCYSLKQLVACTQKEDGDQDSTESLNTDNAKVRWSQTLIKPIEIYIYKCYTIQFSTKPLLLYVRKVIC